MFIDPLVNPYVLEGRIITMGPQGVIPNGAIYIDKGLIKTVQKAGDQVPAGFEGAPRVRTGDTIYPGLIELHNHLSYNAMPLWDVPKKYGNNSQWRGKDAYRRQITKPSQILGGTDGVVQALVRYVECRALLGGVTTSQGITLSSNQGIKKYYKGIVRNVEQPLGPGLPAAGTNIGNPKSGKAAEYLNKLKKNKCYLQHLSEGIDTTARGWFLRLHTEDDKWAVTDAFCGIHSTALTQEDFEIISQRGGSMVWSPTSNYLLYGDTIDLHAAKRSKILMSLGSDWAPSGTKNLLGELKVAYIASKQAQQGTITEGNESGIFTPKEIVAMATINPAKIVKWDKHLGSIREKMRADLTVINGQSEGAESEEDYLRLIQARETSVTLVVIDGVPRVGQSRLMNRFTGRKKQITVGTSPRILNLGQQVADEMVGDLSLTEATERLEKAMANLPDLAQQLDTNTAEGLFSGSTDATGATWRIVPDFEDDDTEIELALGIAAKPYAFYVDSPMELEGITVADDPGHLRKLMLARNLPEFVKKWLPSLYGEYIPLPESAAFLAKKGKEKKFAPQVLTSTGDLKTFLRTSGQLKIEDKKRIVDQALLILEENYVHLPLKRSMHAVDPVQRLRLLRHRLDEAVEGEMPPEIEFHMELISIFNSLRDLHTGYRLPAPFNLKTAWLPFLIEEYWEHGERHYVISKVVDKSAFKHLLGVEVTYWNGTPIHQVVTQNARRQPGSNEAARHARGLNSLTIRPLARSLPPNEEWVILRYIDNKGKVQEYTQEWLIFEPGFGANRLNPEDLFVEASALGLDDHTDDIQEVKKVLYASRVAMAESKGVHRAMRNTPRGLSTYLPYVFRAEEMVDQNNSNKYGYIRIFTFNIRSADEFVHEFMRLVEQLPDNGLIIDVRGNGGGLIYAAEQLLQVLTPRHIEPERAQFINSPLNLKICRNHRSSNRFNGLELREWVDSINKSVKTGATYSLGYLISDKDKCNAIGQHYYGPVVLITDALCYSATDMFAAGFQDHHIGKILGVTTNTGAGGANVWSHGLLCKLMVPDNEPTTSSPYRPLPHGADMRVAIRRTVRVGTNAGDVVEDLGITPNEVHQMTKQDVLSSNEDLIATAITILAKEKPHPIKVTIQRRRNALPSLKIRTRNVSRIEPTVDGRQLHWREVKRNQVTIDLEKELGPVDLESVTVELAGYDEKDRLVVRRKEQVPLR